jgi:hypothetical protein
MTHHVGVGCLPPTPAKYLSHNSIDFFPAGGVNGNSTFRCVPALSLAAEMISSVARPSSPVSSGVSSHATQFTEC